MSRRRVLFCITVYNGADVVPASLRSAAAMKSESADVDVLALDDASPAPGFSEEIRTLCAELGIQYYRSPRNLGIPRNVNLGLLRGLDAGYDHVVIANSDVLFSSTLVDQLLAVAESDPSIGSVTAWSNNASIYSLPNEDPDRFLGDQTVVDRIASILAGEFGPAGVDIPAGISFCIMIPTSVLGVVGLMDPAFGRGYCEETDWSLRSQSYGYRIVLSPSSFTYHRGQGSTGETDILPAGHTTVPSNERLIDMRYPLFRSQCQAFCASEIRDMLWNSARRAILLDAERENGYAIDIGWPRPSAGESQGPRVDFEPTGGRLVPVGHYRGFRMELPMASGDDPVQSVVEFFGRKPRSARRNDHTPDANLLAGSVHELGIALEAAPGYPIACLTGTHVPDVAAPDVLSRSSSRGPEDREWYPGIEALRGIAAMAVVVDHSWALANGSQSFGLGIVPGLGTWGVNVFFLLSGYLLADYFWSGSNRSVLEYYVRRFFRIAPAYYVVVGVLFLFFADHALLFSAVGLHQIFANALFAQWLTPNTSSNLNVDGSLWTLTIEMMLYAVMPLLAYLISKRPIIAASLLAAAGLGFRVFDALGPGTFERWAFGAHSSVSLEIQHLYIARQFLGILPVFVLGMGARWAVLHGGLGGWPKRPVKRFSLVKLLVLLVPSLAMLREVERASFYTHWIWFSGFDLLVCALALPAVLYGSRPVHGQLAPPMRGAVWLGERSYGLYLWHFPVILSLYGMGPSTNPPQLSYLPLRLVGIFALSILLAAGSYRFVEHPGRELGRRLGKRLRQRRQRAVLALPATGEAA